MNWTELNWNVFKVFVICLNKNTFYSNKTYILQQLKTNEKLPTESDKTVKNSVYNINIFFQHVLTKKATPYKPLGFFWALLPRFKCYVFYFDIIFNELNWTERSVRSFLFPFNKQKIHAKVKLKGGNSYIPWCFAANFCLLNRRIKPFKTVW